MFVCFSNASRESQQHPLSLSMYEVPPPSDPSQRKDTNIDVQDKSTADKHDNFLDILQFLTLDESARNNLIKTEFEIISTSPDYSGSNPTISDKLGIEIR